MTSFVRLQLFDALKKYLQCNGAPFFAVLGEALISALGLSSCSSCYRSSH